MGSGASPVSRAASGSAVRSGEFFAALSLATDLGTGQAAEHGLRTCLLALAVTALLVRIAEEDKPGNALIAALGTATALLFFCYASGKVLVHHEWLLAAKNFHLNSWMN